MRRLGRDARQEARVYLTRGSSAVLLAWRSSTDAIDLKIEPDKSDILRLIPELKEELGINVELASPGDFIPEVPGWRDRSPFIAREGTVSFHHYDFYGQALSKIERGHARDLDDVEAMLARELVSKDRLLEFFEQIEPELYRYPAIDRRTFRRAVEQFATT